MLVFASGSSALVYQVAWMRELRLVFGATTAAVAAVLAVFMVGLGAGSVILGRRADRAANPLRFYGTLEVLIALSAALTPLLVELAGSIYIRLGGQGALGLAGATAMRLLLAGVVMAVPTFLMGGTLPAAVRAVTRTTDAHRRALGALYGSNTLGAVCGSALATFFALESLGTRPTLWAGCAISLMAGMIAIARSRTLAPLSTADEPAPPDASRLHAPPAADGAPDAPAPTRVDAGGGKHAGWEGRPEIIYLAAALVGFAFFALELVWYRMLAPILGGTTFTFGLILSVALLGIGAGGIAYDLVFRRLRPNWSILAVTCGCEAALTALPFALGDRIALLAARGAQSTSSFGGLVAGWTVVAFIVVLPVALVAGIQFPLLIALLGEGRRMVSRHLGMAYAWNTLGAIAGSLVAGFGALPLLSAPGLWQALAALLALLSIGLLIAAPRTGWLRASGSARRLAPPSNWRPAAIVAGLALATGALLLAPGPTAVWRHSGIGTGRSGVPIDSGANKLRQWIHEKRLTLAWEADGIESSIAINDQNGLAFVVNGRSDGNALEDFPTQVGLAIFGAMLHPEPRTALVIGLGTGETAGWLAEMPGMQRVDVVELEPALDEMALRCRELNFDVLRHPRVRRIYNDAREFVLTTRDKYDLVVSEPSNPYRAGIASLYTKEFYQDVRRRLNAGGLLVQWLQSYEVDEGTVSIVLATVRSVFDYVEVWQSTPSDLQLVCSATPLEYDLEQLRSRINSGTLGTAVARSWHAHDVEGFLGRFIANERWADQVARTARLPLNTDDRTVLEYRFAKTVGRKTPFSIPALRDQLRTQGHHRPALGRGAIDWDRVEVCRQEFNLLMEAQLSVALLSRPEDRALVRALDRYNNGDFAAVIQEWPLGYRPPTSDIQRQILARSYAELARPECFELISAVEQRYPTEAAALRGIFHYRAGDMAAAAEALETFCARLAQDPWVIRSVAYTALLRAVDVARADANAAGNLYTLLSKPFASWRYEQSRQIARVMVAEKLGPQRVVESLAELEPHIPWTAEVLEARAGAYAATRHPLADRAARDWRRFQRQRSAG